MKAFRLDRESDRMFDLRLRGHWIRLHLRAEELNCVLEQDTCLVLVINGSKQENV